MKRACKKCGCDILDEHPLLQPDDEWDLKEDPTDKNNEWHCEVCEGPGDLYLMVDNRESFEGSVTLCRECLKKGVVVKAKAGEADITAQCL